MEDSIGRGTQPSFPVGIGASGSSGVAGKLRSIDGSIGYVDVAYSLNNGFKFAAIRNRAGHFGLPGSIQIPRRRLAQEAPGKDN